MDNRLAPVVPQTVEQEAKRAEEKYGSLPKKKVRPAKDKKVLPDSIEIARELEQRRLTAESEAREAAKKVEHNY